jgi:uncharacterized SAM-binding protein YcdF (DUF218 family)
MFYIVSKIGWFFATPSNLLPFLILAGLAAMAWPRLRRFGYGLALVAAIALLAAGLSPLANWLIMPLEERFPAFVDDGQPIAGIIVLGGAVQATESFAHDQLMMNEAGERMIEMGDLARRYPQARLVFSGGSGNLVSTEPAEADATERFAGTLGLGSERLIIENRSRTTSENAEFTRALVQPRAGERWLLVTSASHMPRAVGCFRMAGFPVTAYPVDYRTSGERDLVQPFGFLSDGLRRLDVATKEWVGLLAYRLAGHTDALFPRPESRAH